MDGFRCLLEIKIFKSETVERSALKAGDAKTLLSASLSSLSTRMTRSTSLSSLAPKNAAQKKISQPWICLTSKIFCSVTWSLSMWSANIFHYQLDPNTISVNSTRYSTREQEDRWRIVPTAMCHCAYCATNPFILLVVWIRSELILKMICHLFYQPQQSHCLWSIFIVPLNSWLSGFFI